MPRLDNRKAYACRVNILKYVKLANKWRFAPVQLINNKLKFDWVLIDGKPERHPEGTYYIEWYQHGTRRRQSVKDSAEILEQARRKAVELEANKAGLELAPDEQGQRVRLRDALDAYLKEIEPPQREPGTYAAYEYSLELFVAHCSKTYLGDVKREDVMAYIRKQYEMGCGPGTARNRAVIVATFLKASGIHGLLHKRDWPQEVESVRQVYEPEELKAFFAACNPTGRTLFLFYLLTGMRNQEVKYCTWRDVDFRNRVVRVTAKPKWGFKPKNKEEREIPVPGTLLSELQAHWDRQGGKANPNDLVFPTQAGRPDGHQELKLKRIAHKAGLNCGRCETRYGNKCSGGEYCENWFLHKFRHTFATRNLQEHVCDIRTLQQWLGHKDLASTMVYLKAVRSKDVTARVDASGLAAFAAPKADIGIAQAHAVQ